MLKKYPQYLIILDSDEKRPLSKQIKAGLAANATYLVFIGISELKKKAVSIKNLNTKEQITILYDIFINTDLVTLF